LQDSGSKKKEKICKNNIPQDQSLYTRGGEIKVMKKVLNSVLASALLVSVAPAVVGAEEAATTAAPAVDAKLEQVANRLKALGIVQGYADGSLGLDKTITRAEFATLVVRARGLEQAAKLAQFSPLYTDVRATDWFSGYVTISSTNEIIKGFPDKTFKAGKDVTYAESVAMLVRALGYEPAVKGGFPNGYISKAAELGVSNNVVIDANKPATRGDVMKMIDNSLTVDLMIPVTIGSNTDYSTELKTERNKRKSRNLLSMYHDVEVIDMKWANETNNDSEDLPFVSATPLVKLGKLKANQVELSSTTAPLMTGGGTKFDVLEGIDVNSFAGQHVEVWIKKGTQNSVLWMEGSEDEVVVNDKIDRFYVDGKELARATAASADKVTDLDDLELKVAQGKYEFAKNVAVTYNYQDLGTGLAAIKKLVADYERYSVKLVLNEDGKIAYIEARDQRSGSVDDEYLFGSEVIEKVDATKKKIYTLNPDKKDVDLKDLTEGKDFVVFLNGKAAKLADLKELDVYSVYYANGDKDKKIIFATRNLVEGKVTDVDATNKKEDDHSIKIGDTSYKFRTATYSEDNNKTIETITYDQVRDLDDEEVKVYLDGDGRVRHIELKNNVNDRKVKGVITKQAVYNPDKDAYTFTIFTEKDAKQTFTVDGDDFKQEGADGKTSSIAEKDIVAKITPKNPIGFVEVELDSKGEVEKVTLKNVNLNNKLEGAAWDKAADEDDDVLRVGNSRYDITDKTKVFEMVKDVTGDVRKELKDVDLAKFDSVADDDDKTVYYVLDKDGDDVEYLFVTAGGAVEDSATYGHVIKFTKRSGDAYATILVNGETKEYKLNEDDIDEAQEFFDANDFIRFTLNSSDELIVEDVVKIIDTEGATAKLTKIISPDNYDAAELDEVVAIKVEDIKDRQYKFDGDWYATNSSTQYFNMDGKKLTSSDISEDDYVVLVDTDDDGEAFDYVLYVISEDDAKKKDILNEMNNDFLKPTYIEDGGEPADDVATIADASGTEFFGDYVYVIEGTLKSEEDDVDVKVVFEDGVEEEDVTEDGGQFYIEATLAKKYTKATLVVGDQKQTFNITVSEE